MMRKFFAVASLALALFSATIHASDTPVKLDLRDVSVLQFAELVYKQILGKDYLVMPAAVGSSQKLTLTAGSVEKADLSQLASEVLNRAGLSLTDRGSLVVIDSSSGAVPDKGSIPPWVSEAGPLPAPMRAVGSVVPSADAFSPGPFPSIGLDPGRAVKVYRPKSRSAEFLSGVLASVGFGRNALPGADFVLVFDDKWENASQLLAELDIQEQSVTVRAALVEFTDDSSESFGLSALLKLFGNRIQFSLNGESKGLPNYARVSNSSIEALLGMVRGDSRFSLRSEPYLRVVDGKVGTLTVGSDVPIRGSVTVTDSGQLVQSVDYRSAGLLMTVEPRILQEAVYAKFSQEVSSFSTTTSSNIDSPTILKRRIETTLSSRDGEVLVLGGLDERTRSGGTSGLPFLPFSLGKSSSDRSTQLFIFLEFDRVAQSL